MSGMLMSVMMASYWPRGSALSASKPLGACVTWYAPALSSAAVTKVRIVAESSTTNTRAAMLQLYQIPSVASLPRQVRGLLLPGRRLDHDQLPRQLPRQLPGRARDSLRLVEAELKGTPRQHPRLR